MIAEIIPQIRLPKSIGIFDYLVPGELESKIKVGQVVTVPFRSRSIEGVVVQLKKTSTIKKLALVTAIKQDQPLLTDGQIQLIDRLSKYYWLSPALFIKSILPQIPKKVYKKEFKKIIPKNLELKVAKNKIAELKKLSQKIIKEKKGCLFHYDSIGQKTLLYLYLIDYYQAKGQQIAIIVPEMADIAKLYPVIARRFPDAVYYHGQLAKNQQFNLWQGILKCQHKIIMGTRPLSFAPFKNLGLVIIDQEENDSHKQYDQNPRYHVHKVINELHQLYPFKLLMSSRSPSLKTFWRSQRGDINYHNLISISKTNLSLVDLNDELKGGNFTFLSNDLVSKITYHTQNNRQVFLFVNRKGQATRIFCQDCGFLFACPNCGLPFTSHADVKLVCHHCGQQQPSPKTCPNCHNVKIKFSGLGMDKVSASVKKMFPKQKIVSLHADNMDEHNNYSSYDIVIGTLVALRNSHLPNLGMIGIINADSSINFPDFNATEKTYGDLNFLAKFKKNIDVVLQTFSPEHYVIKSLTEDDYQTFYRAEVENREQFGYPPFKKLVKLIFQDPDQKVVTTETEQLFRQLQSRIKKDWEIINLEATPSKRLGRYRRLIIIKYAGQLPNSFIELIPDNWIIDIDPINFE
ncbi:MAG: primosomal protein N' [Patescibacteria group bacterium]